MKLISWRMSTVAVAGICLLAMCMWLAAAAGIVYPTDAHTNTNDLLVLMYHGLLPDDSKGLGDYVISVSELESDLRYLTENGYQSVGIQQVIDCVKHGTALPDKAVMITFDDGYYNNYLYAYPLMKTYAFHMLLSPIAKWSDFYSEQAVSHERYTHVTWDQLREMTNSGLVEVGNHSYDLHTQNQGRKGSAKKTGESTTAYQQLLTADLQRAQDRFQEELGIAPVVFVYPFGEVSRESLDVLRAMGFQAAFTCEEKINSLTNDEDCLYRLGRFKRAHGISSEEFFGKIPS